MKRILVRGPLQKMIRHWSNTASGPAGQCDRPNLGIIHRDDETECALIQINVLTASMSNSASALFGCLIVPENGLCIDRGNDDGICIRQGAGFNKCILAHRHLPVGQISFCDNSFLN